MRLRKAAQRGPDLSRLRGPTRKFITLLVIVGLMLTMVGGVAAQEATPTDDDNSAGQSNSGGGGNIPDSLKTIKDKFDSFAQLLIYIVVAFAAVNFVVGGFQLMTAGASVDREDKGKQRLKYTVAGLVIAGVAQALVTAIDVMVGITNFLVPNLPV